MNKAFYDVKDVMKILNYKKDASYKVIRDLNKELKEKGLRGNIQGVRKVYKNSVEPQLKWGDYLIRRTKNIIS